MLFYQSFITVAVLLMITAPLALSFGMLGALAARARFLPLRAFGQLYIMIVRGVPDIAFFLFFVIALDQGIEWMRHKIKCPDWPEPIRQGAEFIVCKIAKIPLSTAPQWSHEIYGFSLAVITFVIVFGAFCANVIFGSINAVPKNQLETAAAFGMTPRQIFRRIIFRQMWTYALPGLSNLWMILIKATPLLFLLGVEDIVYWARELGGAKTSAFTYPHPDWRLWYFLGLLVFYLALTYISERFFERLSRSLSYGQSTLAGTAQRPET